jgi:hypothetical protein
MSGQKNETMKHIKDMKGFWVGSTHTNLFHVLYVLHG